MAAFVLRYSSTFSICGPNSSILRCVSATAALAAESDTWRGKAVFVGTEFVSLEVADEPEHMLMAGDDEGAVFNDEGEDFLDKAHYQVQWLVDTGGMVGGGYKTFTVDDGQVFAKFEITEYTETGVNGTWEFTKGTEAYEGITGSGTFVVTNVSDNVSWDLLEGEYQLP